MGYSDAILKSDHVGIMVQQWCSDFYIFGALMTKGSKTIRAIILTCFYWIRPADRSTVRAALCGTGQSTPPKVLPRCGVAVQWSFFNQVCQAGHLPDVTSNL